MGTDNQKDYDAIKGRRFPQHMLLLILFAILGTNVVILYAFSNRCNHQDSSGYNGPEVFESSKMGRMLAGNGSRNEVIQSYEKEIAQLRAELKSLHQGTERLILDRTQAIFDELMARPASCGGGEGGGAQYGRDPIDNPFLEWSIGVQNREFERYVEPRKLPLGWSGTLMRDTIISPVGHGCAKMKAELDQYMKYRVGDECPDDEAMTQKLLVGGCEPLPRRRCFSRIPINYTEPYPLPDSLWKAPGDGGVIWTAHTCKSFECLRNRVKEKQFADCLDCFDLEAREKTRWVASGGELDFSVDDVLKVKNGTIRIGLDLGGGTGTFAVRMKEAGVTIITTTLNLNGPFNNFVALRGVIPMYMTVTQRLPFFDNTLDIVHSMHVLSNWIPTVSLEFILYDIDRILRPGGLFWLDHFFCVRSQLATYEPMLKNLGYIKLKYHVGDKVDRGRELQEVYISALLMKPTRRFSTN
ncbi:protein MpPMT.3 [Marchantia polymorpha subsp. ruderalis]|uniref:Methyltransferase type 11 domain-containing protein n=2 Tax=Marchantia polymorpha TaxID=3197 RepID=A0AAF6AYF4_MARPO|nr:hypothetical protein MARPO_0006s0239 [Marchantia polymorpha]BBN04788.1 hypothetical protein Mp_3g07630 [Marchantia polymorpha subsp. ruderalis]|eukprot:PTQ48235.1 hypothetical protein MARPO_0006s0239 [Marchantia polymorpha]